MFKEYTTITGAAKEAARKERRLNYFLKLSGEIYRTEQERDEVKEAVKRHEKDVAIRNFEFAEVSVDHPAYAEKKECVEKRNKDNEESIKHLNEKIAELDKVIAELVQKQQDTVDGKVKMDYDAILERAQELIELNTETEFKAAISA